MIANQFKFIPIVLVFIFFSVISCQNDSNLVEFEIGNDLINTDTKVKVIDTFSVQLSTVQFDSITTSNTDSLLIGRLIDDRLGKLVSKCYFRVTIPSDITIQEGDVYDSVSLVVRLNGYSYGDTTKRQYWKAYRLDETLKVFDNGYLYNNSSFSHEEQSIGSIDFKPYPSRKQEINIPLDEDFGNSLFNMVLDDDERLESADNFFSYLKGFVIEPSNEEMNTILGINIQDTSIVMRIYAHRDAEEREEIELDFQIESGTLPFSEISYDRDNTPLENLLEQKYNIPSTLTGNESYIQGGSGMMTRVDIPGLSRIMELQNSVFMKAELTLWPVANTYEKSRIPSKLLFYKCNKYNQLEHGYTDETTHLNLYGQLSLGNDLYDENNYYTIDITSYVKEELSDNYFEPGKYGLLLFYSDPGYLVTASCLVLGDMYNQSHKAGLKLYFLNYN